MYGFYLLRHANGQTHVCLIASSVKIIAIKRTAVMYGFKSPGWFDVETCMHVLGLWYANTASAIKRMIMIDYKIVSSCTDYVTDYKIWDQVERTAGEAL